MPTVKLGNSDLIQNGEEVLAIGNPKGLNHTMTRGIISQKRIEQGIERIQIDATIAGGSSGGALFNQSGEVIGITTSGIEGVNLNFAVPINYIRGELADLQPRNYVSFERKENLPKTSLKDVADNQNQAPELGFLITKNVDNIRTGPSTDYDVIIKCKRGEVYPILDGPYPYNDWYKITWGDGWKGTSSTSGYTHKSNGVVVESMEQADEILANLNEQEQINYYSDSNSSNEDNYCYISLGEISGSIGLNSISFRGVNSGWFIRKPYIKIWDFYYSAGTKYEDFESKSSYGFMWDYEYDYDFLSYGYLIYEQFFHVDQINTDCEECLFDVIDFGFGMNLVLDENDYSYLNLRIGYRYNLNEDNHFNSYEYDSYRALEGSYFNLSLGLGRAPYLFN